MNHLFGILFSPKKEWDNIRERNDSIAGIYLKFIVLIALLPPVAWYVGATQVGWSFAGRVIRLTPDSAMQILVLFYISILLGVGFLGFMVHWMSETYGVEGSSYSRGVGIAAYTCTPLFVCGAIGFYPLLWLDILLGCAATAYSVYLLYIGVPIVMQIPKERGFLYASAMVGVGLVMCAALLGATVILWEMGAMPVFSD
ncbi:MAG: YIP1 family protein [Proteobacteria bacterium]|nr:YIP1 family protein [Pseudomonadota bacterium]